LLSHTGSDKSNYKQRIERHSICKGGIFEAIDYGTKDSAMDIVIAWIVDDGVARRTNRNNLLLVDYAHCAVATGVHE
jgi:uncharacterized protein YkwD